MARRLRSQAAARESESPTRTLRDVKRRKPNPPKTPSAAALARRAGADGVASARPSRARDARVAEGPTRSDNRENVDANLPGTRRQTSASPSESCAADCLGPSDTSKPGSCALDRSASDSAPQESQDADAAASQDTEPKHTLKTNPAGLTKDRVHKLNELLDQTNLYTQFLTEQVAEMFHGYSTKDKSNLPDGTAEDAAEDEDAAPSTAGLAALMGVKPVNAADVNFLELNLLKGKLRDYQFQGITWMVSMWANGLNGMLADEMGLGKTVQTIGFLSHLKQSNIHGPFLVICPMSTLSNWRDEFNKWLPDMKTTTYHGEKAERHKVGHGLMRRFAEGMEPEVTKSKSKMSKAELEEFKNAKEARVRVREDKWRCILTTYDIAVRDMHILSKTTYKSVIIDEGHRLKNCRCKTIQSLAQLRTENKFLLTGTPLQNDLSELWSLLNFILPEVFANENDFKSWFDFNNVVSFDDSKTKEVLKEEMQQDMIHKLHQVLRPFLLRRIKEEVETCLPPKQEIILYAPKSTLQCEVEATLLNKSTLQEAQKTPGRNARQLNNIVMQLRKNCNHPDLVTSEWDVKARMQPSEYPSADVLVEQCGKLHLLQRVLDKLIKDGHKTLIFSQFVMMLDLLDAYLADRQVAACRLDGGMGLEERAEQIEAFNSDDGPSVFMLSTRAGGIGINLTAADTVIFYDSDWNPQQDLQAMDRVHRIGQKKPVLVLRLCTSSSVEVHLLQRAQSKLTLERLVIKDGQFKEALKVKNSVQELSKEELLQLLKPGCQLKGGNESGVTDDVLDKLLDRTHLAKKTSLPYSTHGEGYEVVVGRRGNLLSGISKFKE